jgi:hypothetical protein
MLIRNLLLTAFILSLAGCSYIPLNNMPVWKYDIFERPPDNKEYPDAYITGWQHGCESGAQASSNHMYRLKYQFKQDWKMLNTPDYTKGWEDAYNLCRKYVLQQNLGTYAE